MEKVNACHFFYLVNAASIVVKAFLAGDILAIESYSGVAVIICKENLVEGVWNKNLILSYAAMPILACEYRAGDNEYSYGNANSGFAEQWQTGSVKHQICAAG